MFSIAFSNNNDCLERGVDDVFINQVLRTLWCQGAKMELLEYSGDHTGRHFDLFSINRGSKYRFPFVFFFD
jgi:hypothetical protein